MSSRLVLIASIIFAVISFIFWLWKKAESDCKNKHLISDQAQEIIVKDHIITETKQVYERRNETLRANPDDNLLWLEENLCQDCR
jgi:hypothetical protein